MTIAAEVAKRSTCLRRKVGAVLVRDKRILATGYNGAPRNVAHCSVTGCMRERLNVPSGERHELCRGLHAEMNALLQAAEHGVCIKDSVIYCTNQPCSLCAKMLINVGVKKIIITDGYPDKLATEMLAEAEVDVVRLADAE
jgi:dCMP deaminase